MRRVSARCRIARRAFGNASLSVPFALSHVPVGNENWVELLAAGLTCDCHGLAPVGGATHPGDGAPLGLDEPPAGEVVTLQPAPHLAEGAGLFPVVRILTGPGAQLARLPGLLAVYWYPSRRWMAPKYFCGVIEAWLAGGPFPPLGLTSLRRECDGVRVSAGLDFLIALELHFQPDRRLVPAAAAKIAVRLIDDLG